jgi:hypothetical protein
MANIPRAENIDYNCSNLKIARALHAMLASDENKNTTYNLGFAPQLIEKSVFCGLGSSRWSFWNNIIIAFSDLPAYYGTLTPEIANFICMMYEHKGVIECEFDDNEPGMDYSAHVTCKITSNGRDISVEKISETPLNKLN